MLTCTRCGGFPVIHHIYLHEIVGPPEKLVPPRYKGPEDLGGEELDLWGSGVYCEQCSNALRNRFRLY